ncbi:MAG: sulfite exporter TauE/SafE family protein [Clostridia bacterium]|nr:sulfite exporter TauE/SafE family protein [Clostridia bacterium]
MDWITVIASFVVAVLSGMGIGSAGLLVVFLTMIAGVPQLTAQGINLLFFLFAAASALCVHITHRNIPFLHVSIAALAGMIGTLPGTFAAGILPQDWVRILFGIMLILAGVRGMFGKAKNKKQKNKKSA